MLDKKGEVRVTGFGLARRTEDDVEVTADGAVVWHSRPRLCALAPAPRKHSRGRLCHISVPEVAARKAWAEIEALALSAYGTTTAVRNIGLRRVGGE